MQQRRTSAYPNTLTAALVLMAVLLTAPQAWAQVEFRINAGPFGEPDYVDVNGDVFAADKAFVPGDFGAIGGVAATVSGVTGTSDVDLYGSFRVALDPFSYIFDALPPDDYDVTLLAGATLKTTTAQYAVAGMTPDGNFVDYTANITNGGGSPSDTNTSRRAVGIVQTYPSAGSNEVTVRMHGLSKARCAASITAGA